MRGVSGRERMWVVRGEAGDEIGQDVAKVVESAEMARLLLRRGGGVMMRIPGRKVRLAMWMLMWTWNSGYWETVGLVTGGEILGRFLVLTFVAALVIHNSGPAGWWCSSPSTLSAEGVVQFVELLSMRPSS